jgi:L,D-transpeptidase YcbB
MSDSWSWLHNSASKLTERRHIPGKLVAGIVIVGLVLMGYAYGPATADNNAASASAESPKASAPIVLAQAPDAEVQKLIPLPEPANIPPPTAADFERAAPEPTDREIQALIPVPEPADVAPLTAADFAEESQTTAAAEPAAEPKPDATAATPAPASPTEEPKQEAKTPTSAEPAQETATAEPVSEPQLSAEEIKKLTGKDLVQAPIAESLSAADSAIAESLREQLAGRFDRFVSRRDDRQALEVFYRDRGFAPLWIENGSRGARATAAIHYLNSIETHGLEPSDYPVPNFAAASDDQALAEAELRFTNSVLDYVRHARTGRFHFSRLTGDIHYALDAPAPVEVLTGISKATDIAAELDRHQPQHPQYRALKAKLAEARRETNRKEIVRVPSGPTLRLEMEDPRVAALRKRLEIPGGRDSHVYDAEVEAAVVAFQKSNGLIADGLAGPATLAALNGVENADKVDTIIVNMERWRWLPRDLGRSYVTVNLPDFRTTVTRNGRNVWSTKTITGRTGGRETPLISTAMKSITVNPTWNVPQSIIAKDYLPALQQDPGVMDRMGIRIEENRDGTIRMYQPPGDGNALGRLRFNTPNQFLVYLHDTPDKKLFDRDQRTFSAGCMRVQDPAKFAEIVLSIMMPNENYTQERVQRMYGPNEININFPNELPVHITYQTAWVDEAGQLRMRRDVYGHDSRMIGVLNGANRQVADNPVPKPKQTFAREELRLPNGVYYGSYDGYNRGYGRNPVEDFFRSIFR